MHGNVCDSNDNIDGPDSSDGIGVIESRYVAVTDNVPTANRSGVTYAGDPSGAPEGTDMGRHLLGGNVYDRNRASDPIKIGPGASAGPAAARSVARRRRRRHQPSAKPTQGDPAKPVDGALYLNIFDRKLSVYANGEWRNLQSW